jgi:hypothetical protein
MLLLMLGALVAIGLVVEVLNFIAREFLSGVRREDALKADLKQIETDLTEAAGKMSGMKNELRKALAELDRAKTAYHDLEKEMARRQRVEPVLVYQLGQESAAGVRFRAPVTKALPEEPDANQKRLWQRQNFVEVWTASEDKARTLAAEQFPAKHGYTIGAFVRTGDDALEKAEAA